MRTNSISLSPINLTNDDTCRKDCTFEHTQISLPSSSLKKDYEFISCVWRECEGESGGGISLSVTDDNSITLSVTNGEFYSCTATRYEGGGIYIYGINKATITDSLFLTCRTEAPNDGIGGGIDLSSIQDYPLVQSSSFISCTSGCDAGGLAFRPCPKWEHVCVVSCHFVNCEGQNTQSTDAGSYEVWDSNAAIGCSNTLFVNSHAERRGGASTIGIDNSARHSDSIHLFCFCFFNDNSAEFKPGNDVFFYEWKPTEPFLHCFSTTKEYRISYYSNNDYHFDKDDWLFLFDHIMQMLLLQTNFIL